jgi:autophagy-related protein 2
MSKSLLDGLQLWADDVSQLMERTFGSICDTDTERAESRNPSLIGSRFFAKSRRYGSKSSEASSTGFNEACAEAPSETVIKFAFSEGSVVQIVANLTGLISCPQKLYSVREAQASS